MIRTSDKLVELEAVRGSAAIIVLVHHSLLAFAPRLEGLFFPAERFGLFGTPFYAFVNGAASVILFFVLSGFVLTYRAIEARDASGIGMAALKRWPRLAGPVVIVSFVSGLLVWWGMYDNLPAAEISRSPWLKGWFAASPYSSAPPLAAVQEGLLDTFLQGRSYFNGNLWTMHYEFFGSFIALALALVVIELGRPRLSLLLSCGLLILTLYQSRYFAPFVAGVIAAQIYSLAGKYKIRLRLGPALAVAVAAFLLFGFKHGGPEIAHGFYAGMKPLLGLSLLEIEILIHTIAALLIMILAMTFEPCRKLLGGRAGLWLGRMSFPVYLTHLIVICTLGSSTFVAVKPLLPHSIAVVLTLSVVFGVTLVVSYPLAIFDRAWISFIKKAVKNLRRKPDHYGRSSTLQPMARSNTPGRMASSTLAA